MRRQSRVLSCVATVGALLVGSSFASAAGRYEYDSANRLSKVTNAGRVVTYAYDALGNMVQRCDGATCTDLVVDDSVANAKVVAEVSPGSEVLYAYGPGGLVAVQSNGTARWAAADQVGSVRALVTDAGRLDARASYDAYGRPRAKTAAAGVTNNMGFTGEYTGPSDGVVWLRARSYQPEIGQFLQRDSFAGFADDPQSLNRYAYTEGNPLGATDPSGHFTGTRPSPADSARAYNDLGTLAGGLASGLANGIADFGGRGPMRALHPEMTPLPDFSYEDAVDKLVGPCASSRLRNPRDAASNLGKLLSLPVALALGGLAGRLGGLGGGGRGPRGVEPGPEPTLPSRAQGAAPAPTGSFPQNSIGRPGPHRAADLRAAQREMMDAPGLGITGPDGTWVRVHDARVRPMTTTIDGQTVHTTALDLKVSEWRAGAADYTTYDITIRGATWRR